jgi:hypothetical protein
LKGVVVGPSRLKAAPVAEVVGRLDLDISVDFEKKILFQFMYSNF